MGLDEVTVEVQIDWEGEHLHQVFEVNGERWACDLTAHEARALAVALVQAAGGSWSCASRPRVDKAPTCPKTLWEAQR